MKKILFFFGFIGTDTEPVDIVASRLNYVSQQMSYLSEVLKEHPIFDKRYAIFTSPNYLDKTIPDICEQLNFDLYPVSHNFYRDNVFEYPGMRAMREESENDKDSLFFYSHSKGSGCSSPLSESIFKLHIKECLTCNVDSIFNDIEIQKAGLFPSQEGWLWHNFFWVRSSYFSTKEVKLEEDRYKYESLVGERGNIDGYRAAFPLMTNSSFFLPFPRKKVYMPNDLDINPIFKKMLENV